MVTDNVKLDGCFKCVLYFFSSNGNDLAFVNDGQETATEDAVPATQSEEDIEVENIENVDSDELFTTIRMEIQDERSRKKKSVNRCSGFSKCITN